MLHLLSISCAFCLGAISHLVWTRRNRRRWKSNMHDVLTQLQEAVRAAVHQKAGPADVFTWPDVSRAPPATIKTDDLRPGESSSFTDDRGTIYRFKITEDTLLNLYYTRKGVRRSGDLHDSVQFDLVLSGRVRLRQLDPTGKEIVSHHDSNDYIVIPPNTPHMFEMLEDNVLVEWWGADFRAWYYKPYRDIISVGLPLEATDNVDFSRS